MMTVKEYPITAMGKPRMTRADKWKKRDCVLRYRAFKDEVRLYNVSLPESGYHLIFVMPMPQSWSKKKKAEMNGKPHQQKPDKDNLEKALLDALFEDDCRIWDGRVTKIWGEMGKIVVKELQNGG
ncbi:TPA: RusA family crossover junction endodeoxyribonuclease [Mannheimia haemolytica]|uniref:RusA family crossover junction endodeoxyribonuclease n=1 Tax=Mannheimia haemolytica TaxID=75985 RepID=UPI001E5D5C81|nr:RusA family crossover junction endodeoxyribonuclease [Mannheimia haemolytica]MDW0617861.1 RusA family crossover junction endodeoxyribonuclease [Mannheimia haemolytica]UFK42063.1 RusA family crossover junction endodeoxyribonuclease [Mannheimia haemolytica]HDL1113754.1 RusA family crossover junction endodeoxyribonuclease [Mannheimia haemolytica]HDL1116205.1 RusA family crossover junction endodeoxyribonuclease [Mannheimia haemolytica]HDL1124815.1 RusA family crossover junction endodeoxyribonuc